MSNYESKPPRIGLWANERGPMASGNCGALRFVLWDNRSRKKGTNGPDYQLVIEQSQPRDGERKEQKSGGGGGSFPGGRLPDDDDEAIPF